MSQAKGSRDISQAIGAIQQLICKPEWKTLVQEVLENQDITKKLQENVVAVANAVVTPLSLLVFAVGLSDEQIQQCVNLWQDTLKKLKAHCMMKADKSTEVHFDGELDLRTLEALFKSDEKVNEQLNENPFVPSQPDKVAPQPTYQFESSEVNNDEMAQGQPIVVNSDSDAPAESLNMAVDQEDEPNEILSPSPKSVGENTVFLPNESETSVGIAASRANRIVEIEKMNEASFELRQGKRSNQVLANRAAKKGLVQDKDFYRRLRDEIVKVRLSYDISKTIFRVTRQAIQNKWRRH